MSETTPTALENTDLTNSSATAQNAQTPGETDSTANADRTTEQMPDTPDPSIVPSLENTPFQAADYEVFKQLAHELNLSSEQVEKWLAFEKNCAQHHTQQAQDKKREQIAAWAQQTRAMYGEKLDQEIAFALRAANTFGGPDLRELLEETGLGNHPVVIRTLSGIGRTISEDISAGGMPSAPQDKTFAEALYGKRN